MVPSISAAFVNHAQWQSVIGDCQGILNNSSIRNRKTIHLSTPSLLKKEAGSFRTIPPPAALSLLIPCRELTCAEERWYSLCTFEHLKAAQLPHVSNDLVSNAVRASQPPSCSQCFEDLSFPDSLAREASISAW